MELRQRRLDALMPGLYLPEGWAPVYLSQPRSMYKARAPGGLAARAQGGAAH